jgi:hypothetical protein
MSLILGDKVKSHFNIILSSVPVIYKIVPFIFLVIILCDTAGLDLMCH